MRIRQRKKAFPLSSFSPALSDPNPISRSSAAVVQLNDDATPLEPSTPQPHRSAFSDGRQLDQKLPPIQFDSTGESGVQIQARDTEEDCLAEDGRDQEAGEGEKGNDTRKGDIFGSTSNTALEVVSPSSPSNQDWSWCEGERAIPLKKRRGSFQRRIVAGQTAAFEQHEGEKMKTKAASNNSKKMKTNKKCSSDNEQHEGEKKRPSNGGGGKKRVRGSALMEGSRCSRVNGRGWRCCQPTLVGYSLCEHHLGKGRLRSMSSASVKVSSSVGGAEYSAPKLGDSSSSVVSEKVTTKCVPLGKNDDGEDEKKPLTSMKKRMKLGVVKARSISSLLCQTKTEIAVAENTK